MATFGDTTAGSDTINLSANQSLLTRFTGLGVSADITEVQCYCRASSGTANGKGLVYDDTSGPLPNNLKLATSVLASIPNTAGWRVFTGTATVTSGTYWIGCALDAAWVAYEDNIAGVETSIKNSNYSSPANPYGSESGNDDGFQFNAHFVYTESGGGGGGNNNNLLLLGVG